MAESRRKPWYACTTKETIKQDPAAVYYEDGAGDYAPLYEPLLSLRYRHTSTHNGYIKRTDTALLPYSGKFGEGYIFVTYHSPYRVLWKYFVKERVKNGKTN